MVSYPPNNISQLGWLFPIHGKINMFQSPPTSLGWLHPLLFKNTIPLIQWSPRSAPPGDPDVLSSTRALKPHALIGQALQDLNVIHVKWYFWWLPNHVWRVQELQHMYYTIRCFRVHVEGCGRRRVSSIPLSHPEGEPEKLATTKACREPEIQRNHQENSSKQKTKRQRVKFTRTKILDRHI